MGNPVIKVREAEESRAARSVLVQVVRDLMGEAASAVVSEAVGADLEAVRAALGSSILRLSPPCACAQPGCRRWKLRNGLIASSARGGSCALVLPSKIHSLRPIKIIER